MSPAALHGIAARSQRRQFECTAETGCGGSTILLSHLSRRHTAFALEGADLTVSELKRRDDLVVDRVEFIEGETRFTLPVFGFQSKLDLLLLDGPHAYPLPQIEFAYLFPHLKTGGWMVLDDLEIPSVYELFKFVKTSGEVVLEEVAGRTAFFRRTQQSDHDVGNPDGWWLQEMNRSMVWRYSWRDRLRRLLRRRAST